MNVGLKSEIIIVSSVFFVRMVDRNKKIVEFLHTKWISSVKNNSKFALDHRIDEKTVRLIKDKGDYRTRLDTMINICEGENLNLSQFFQELEQEHPEFKFSKK